MDIRTLFDARALFLNNIFTRFEYIDKLKNIMQINESILSELICRKDKLCNVFLNEADLGKVPLGNLYTLGSDVGKNLLPSLNGMTVLVSSHTYADGSNRYIEDKDVRGYILPLSYEGYRNHMKFILEEVNLKFKKKFSSELTDLLIKKFKTVYPSITAIKEYDDRFNDVHCKFSIYKLLNFKNALYMLEGALAVNISILSYDKKPLINIKNTHDEASFQTLMNKVSSVYRSKLNSDIKKQKGVPKHNTNIKDEKINILQNIDKIDLTKPILSITGYSTIFKEVDKDTLRYVPNQDFGQDQYSNDIYVSQVTDKDLLLCFPIDNGESSKLKDSEFETLRRFEKARPKHGS